jgi:hypothetical protein
LVAETTAAPDVRGAESVRWSMGSETIAVATSRAFASGFRVRRLLLNGGFWRPRAAVVETGQARSSWLSGAAAVPGAVEATGGLHEARRVSGGGDRETIGRA